MTLRLRLVLALLGLVAVGLGVFGLVTYSLFSSSEYQRLDDQVRAAVPLLTRNLTGSTTGSGPDARGDGGGGGFGAGARPGGSATTTGPGGPGPTTGGSGGAGAGPDTVLPPGTFAELLDRSGAVVNQVVTQLSTSTVDPPKLPAGAQSGRSGRLFTAHSASGAITYRVLVSPAPGPGGGTIVVALPLGQVTASLHRLVLIESTAALGLLAVLSAGALLILRRGLRPLERMAATAGTIAAGDLSQRVTPDGGPTEVGQLGLALNTMLAGIEQAFAERDATEARLRQFLADASHELRTPLTSIQGFAELFRLGADHDHVDLATMMRRIEEESARMKVLVEDLLLLARLDQTRPVERTAVDLAVLAADACSDAVAAEPDRPVTLDAPEPVVILANEPHLRQAIANLVANAERHTAAGTAIEVSARLDDGSALLVVRDHGAGLDDAALAHAFDRFWQADQARVGTGAGLGLSIVAGIAAEHGGTASVANAADHGAVFTLRLPVSVAADATGPSPSYR